MNHSHDSLVPSFLELEFTTYCQLACVHCLSDSGPQGDPGTMSTEDWEKTIDQAAALGVSTVQFIGGEPTLDRRLPRLTRHALRAGLAVDIYTNLVHVTDEMWNLFQLRGVSLGFSWYTTDPAKHASVTGSRGSYARTRANLCEALQRGIPVRAGIVEVVEDQGIQEAAAELRRLGVTSIQVDRARRIGRAAGGQLPQISELCGRCGHDRAAIGRDGRVTPCVLGRFLVAGNVRDTPLADILGGGRWREIVATVPPQNACVTCTPADSNDCNPSRKP
jgi:MoaA/NifB/PqqE/SkfB family radical SAM enzyme